MGARKVKRRILLRHHPGRMEEEWRPWNARGGVEEGYERFYDRGEGAEDCDWFRISVVETK